MSVSTIPDKVKYMLWTVSAGKCQYRGCNKPLYQDILTKRRFNSAYIAHIVADVPGGPRGDKKRSPLLADKLENLMLLCDTHHRLIDKIDVAGHPEDVLLKMKKEHEDRIARVTAIASDMQSHIVTYRANVGVHTPPVNYEVVSEFLLPNHYPATSSAIDLGLNNSPFRDKNATFWAAELENLETQFKEQLTPKLRKGELKHISLFALAPMPLLIKLGTLLNDISNVTVHQPVRNPKTWKLDDSTPGTVYEVITPDIKKDIVALNISLSATINNDRITDVLGENVAIYTLTIDSPFNDYLKSKKQLETFSIEIRKLFDKIKAEYNGITPLHIFPTMPVATAIELGRVWMPKADMPMHIYDENTANPGFFKALEIINE